MDIPLTHTLAEESSARQNTWHGFLLRQGFFQLGCGLLLFCAARFILPIHQIPQISRRLAKSAELKPGQSGATLRCADMQVQPTKSVLFLLRLKVKHSQ